MPHPPATTTTAPSSVLRCTATAALVPPRFRVTRPDGVGDFHFAGQREEILAAINHSPADAGHA
jgi:hypothetical protein